MLREAKRTRQCRQIPRFRQISTLKLRTTITLGNVLNSSRAKQSKFRVNKLDAFKFDGVVKCGINGHKSLGTRTKKHNKRWQERKIIDVARGLNSHI